MGREVIPNYSEAPRPDLYARSIDRTTRTINRLFNFQAFGQENVPQVEIPTIIAFSHRSYIDPWVLGISVPRAIHGMAKKELLRPYYMGLGKKYLANRGTFFVDRKGGVSSDAIRASLEALEARKLIGIAPEGTSRNRGTKLGETKVGVGRIALLAAKKGIEDIRIITVGMTTEKPLRSRKIASKISRPIAVSDFVTTGTRYTKDETREIAGEINHRVEEVLQSTFDEALELQSEL